MRYSTSTTSARGGYRTLALPLAALTLILGATPAASAQSAPQPPAPAPAPVEPTAEAENTCDLSKPMGTPLVGCRTPRDGILSGGYMALDLGYGRLERSAARRIGAGPGAGVHLRFAVEFWDHLVVGIGIAGLLLDDRQPISEMVVDCTTVNNTVISCDDDPHSQSSIVAATLFPVEIAAQQRFRPWSSSSFTPGAALGCQWALSDLKRGVQCKGCREIDLDATAAGAYVTPFLRTTFGELGELAVIVRWSLYLTGDVAHVATLGIEYGLP
jgi:hypothetical protein